MKYQEVIDKRNHIVWDIWSTQYNHGDIVTRDHKYKYRVHDPWYYRWLRKLFGVPLPKLILQMKPYIVKRLPIYSYSRREYLEQIPDWVSREPSFRIQLSDSFWTIVLHDVVAQPNDLVVQTRSGPRIQNYKDYMEEHSITDISELYE